MFKNVLLINFLFFLLNSCVYPQSIDLVRNKQSNYVIVIPKDPPQSIKAASTELQKCIEIASGAKIPIKFDNESIEGAFISLGKTKFAIRYDGIDDNGYCIKTENHNIYIFGNDSPDGQTTKYGGTTNGTSNGVYSFLEDYLGVRWLMPGDLGRDVPPQSDIAIEEIDIQYTPPFDWRRLSNLQDFSDSKQKKSVQQWMDFQKLGSNYDISYEHNWDWIRTDVPDVYNKHPDWFAYREGKRQEPLRPTFKLETTNPQLVNFFADRAVKELKQSSKTTTFSLSPNDDRFWSESAESRRYYDPAPEGRDHELVTRLVLKWYSDVAEAVGKKYPQGRLAGYLYSDYFFPPSEGDISFPKNFIPVVTGTPNYGYKLFRQKNQNMLSSALEGWSKGNPSFWIYFDMPNQLFRHDMSSTNNFPGTSGTVTPTGVKILDFLFPLLIKNKFNGASLYGSPSWSNSAMSNYVLAKLLWNPSMQASELQEEWLIRAYGLNAGKIMLSFYDKLESLFYSYYNANDDANYKLTEDMLNKIYAGNYIDLEKLYLSAKEQKMSDIQSQRLALIEKNLIVLQWRLKSLNFLKSNYQSPLTYSAEQIAKIIESEGSDFQVFPGIIPLKRLIPAFPKFKLEFSKTAISNSKQKLSNSAKNTYLIVSAKRQSITIIPKDVKQGLLLCSYILVDQNNNSISQGMIMNNQAITFSAKANTPYYLYIPARKNVTYNLEVKNGKPMLGEFKSKNIIINTSKDNGSVFVQTLSGDNNGIEFN